MPRYRTLSRDRKWPCASHGPMISCIAGPAHSHVIHLPFPLFPDPIQQRPLHSPPTPDPRLPRKTFVSTACGESREPRRASSREPCSQGASTCEAVRMRGCGRLLESRVLRNGHWEVIMINNDGVLTYLPSPTAAHFCAEPFYLLGIQLPLAFL